MRLRLALAALIVVALLTAPAGALPAGGAEPTPTPGYWSYLPVVVAPPPTPTATPTASPTPTRAPAAACYGDEAISFAPAAGATGSPIVVSATSARPSVNVALQVTYAGAAQPLAWQGVTTGGKGYIWSWTFTPAQPGQYTASFFVDGAAFCSAALVQVTGSALPTATPTATALPTATATPFPGRSAACMDDEEMSFAPSTGATGSQVAVSVTSARPSTNVALQVVFQGAAQTVNWGGVTAGGKGYIWTWNFTPYQPGWYAATFYVNNIDFCAGAAVQVTGSAIATPTPVRTATPTATPPSAPTPTPTVAPTAPPGGVVWDWRLGFLGIGIDGAPAAPGQQYWKVTRGVFENHIEGGGGHAIGVEILDQWGNRVSLPYGTEVGFATNGGTVGLAWTKLDQPYPVVYDIYGGLGSYSVWITLWGLPSERVTRMGLVASDGTDAPLLAEPGKVHVNYLITFRRTTRSAVMLDLEPREPACRPDWRGWRSPLRQGPLLIDPSCGQ